MRWIIAAASVLLMVILPEIVSITGSIEGIISDDTRPVKGAHIEARHTMSGIVYRGVSGPEGRYALQSVRKGQYALWVHAAGYNPVEIAHVVVETNRVTRCDVKLRRTAPMHTAARQAHLFPLLLQ